jgi:hypothetical protein
VKNKTSENARKLPESFFKKINESKNSKYGQFIIQTNEVQFYLIFLIILKTALPSKKLKEYLEECTLGNLIYKFKTCSNEPFELSLIESLKKYNESRNSLAHKMFTREKLTEKECELSVELGEEILISLKFLSKSIWSNKKYNL